MSCISLGSDSTPLVPAFVGATPSMLVLLPPTGPTLAEAISCSEVRNVPSIEESPTMASNPSLSNLTRFVPVSPVCNARLPRLRCHQNNRTAAAMGCAIANNKKLISRRIHVGNTYSAKQAIRTTTTFADKINQLI